MSRWPIAAVLAFALGVGAVTLTTPAVSQDIGWKAYTDMRVEELEKRVNQRFDSSDKALRLAQDQFPTKDDFSKLREEVTKLQLGGAVTGPFVSTLVALGIGAALTWFAFYLRAKKPPAGG